MEINKKAETIEIDKIDEIAEITIADEEAKKIQEEAKSKADEIEAYKKTIELLQKEKDDLSKKYTNLSNPIKKDDEIAEIEPDNGTMSFGIHPSSFK